MDPKTETRKACYMHNYMHRLVMCGFAPVVILAACTAGAPLRAALAGIGLRSAAIGQILASQHVDPSNETAAAALTLACSQLCSAGLRVDAVAKLLQQQPRVLPALIQLPPASVYAWRATLKVDGSQPQNSHRTKPQTSEWALLPE